MTKSGRSRIEIWVEDWLLDRLGKYAKKIDLTKAEVVRMALKDHLFRCHQLPYD